MRDPCLAAQAAGFAGVEVVLGPDLVSSAGEAAKLPEAGVNVLSVACACRSIARKAALAEVEAFVDLGERLGAASLNLTLPPVRGCGCDPVGGFVSYADALNLAHDLLVGLRLLAERTGVAVAIESAADGFLLSPVEARELVDAGASWAMGICLDVTRVERVGCPVDWAIALGRRVRCLRIPQAPTGAAACGHWRTIERLAGALGSIGYDGHVILALRDGPVDPPALERLARSVQEAFASPPKARSG